MADYNSDRTGANIDATLDKVDALDAKISPTASGVEVDGNMQLDSSNASLNLKSGVTGTEGYVNWTFNTESTAYSRVGIAYDDRATTGFLVDSLYPITFDTVTRIIFKKNGTERARLDPNGNFLVGTTNASPATSDVTGVALKAGVSQLSNSNDLALRLNRSTDGAIQEFRKDGSTVGSIGTKSGGLTVTNGDTGLGFYGQYDIISPVDATGGSRDAAIDLGYTGQRFRNIYLSNDVKASRLIVDDSNGGDINIKKDGVASAFIGEQEAGLGSGDGMLLYTYNSGTIKFYPQATNVAEMTNAGLIMSSGKGIYLGGTGSENKLDDYETGDWTPTVGSSGGGQSVTYGVTREGRYTKVGSLVHLDMVVSWSAFSGGSGTARIFGIPFAIGSLRAVGCSGYVAGINITNSLTANGSQSNVYFDLREMPTGTGSSQSITPAQFASGGELQLSITYYTTA